MSHKYLDQLTLEELEHIHKTYVNSDEKHIQCRRVVNFYDDMFVLFVKTINVEDTPEWDVGYTYQYDDFDAPVLLDNDAWYGHCVVNKSGYLNWMAQRFGYPYVLDLIQTGLGIDLSKINKPAPAKGPDSRLCKMLQKGVPDGRR